MVMEDKAYEELDFVSKLIEPWDFTVMKVLSQMQPEYVLTVEQILATDTYNSHARQANDIILPSLTLDGIPKWAVEAAFELSHFSFEMVGEPVLVDTLSLDKEGGDIVLRVEVPTLEMIPCGLVRILFSHLYCKNISSLFAKERINEVMDVLEVSKMERKRFRQKMDAVYRGLINIIEQDRWRIRSDQVLVNMIEWIFTYITTGNYSAYASLLNLKCMVHRGNPIYSAEEI